MDVTNLLILLFVGALATYLSGDKLASKVALLFGLGAFGFSVYLLNQFNAGQNLDFVAAWITKPNIAFALKTDGLALAMVLLTTALTPSIIFSSFGNDFKNANANYALI